MVGKVFSRNFQRYNTNPQIPIISVGKPPKNQTYSRLATIKQAGPKKPQ